MLLSRQLWKSLVWSRHHLTDGTSNSLSNPHRCWLPPRLTSHRFCLSFPYLWQAKHQPEGPSTQSILLIQTWNQNWRRQISTAETQKKDSLIKLKTEFSLASKLELLPVGWFVKKPKKMSEANISSLAPKLVSQKNLNSETIILYMIHWLVAFTAYVNFWQVFVFFVWVYTLYLFLRIFLPCAFFLMW